MLTNNTSISFLGTSNAGASRQFYETVLGLTFVADERFALVFDLDGHTLRITKIGNFKAPAHTVLGWRVDDIAAKVGELSAQGVQFLRLRDMPQDELGIWTSPTGAKVAWFLDPDGNNLTLTQFPV